MLFSIYRGCGFFDKLDDKISGTGSSAGDVAGDAKNKASDAVSVVQSNQFNPSGISPGEAEESKASTPFDIVHSTVQSTLFDNAVAAARAAEAGELVAAVTRAFASMTSADFLRHCSSPPSQLKIPCEYSITCYRMPVFVGGRDLKFTRIVSQSRWLIDDERMGEGSVQEVFGNVVFPHYKGDSYKFHATGREDIEVSHLL